MDTNDPMNDKEGAARRGDDEIVEVVRESLPPQVSPDLASRMRATLDRFRSQLASHPHVGRGERASMGHRRRVAYTLVAALTLCALVAGGFWAIGSAAPTWAQIAGSFQKVSFFQVTIYLKESLLSPVEQVELWIGDKGRARLRGGGGVVYASAGRATKAFDLKTREEVAPGENAQLILEALGATETFSLESILRIFSGALIDVTPRVNRHARVSEDLVVYDVVLDDESRWLRVWALHDSKLPVRVVMWSPLGGESAEAMFTYSHSPSTKFFDPEAFSSLLSDTSKTDMELAYAFLEDPGDRPISRSDLHGSVRLHVPEVQEAGVTDDGAVWVLSAQAQSMLPPGGTKKGVYGFQEIEDDLGREYHRVYGGHRLKDDVALQIFVPLGYPFDERRPSSISLKCRIRDETVDLTTWKASAPFPGLWNDEEVYPRIRLAEEFLFRRQDVSRAERVLATIEGTPRDAPEALLRDQLRLDALVRQGKFPQAVELGERLQPLREKKYEERRVDVWRFNSYVVALAATGQLEKARSVIEGLREIEPKFPPSAPAVGVGRELRRHREEFDTNVQRVLLQELRQRARLSVSDVERVLGIDGRE